MSRITLLVACVVMLGAASVEVEPPTGEKAHRMLAAYQQALETEAHLVQQWMAGHGDRLRAVRQDRDMPSERKRERMIELGEEMRAAQDRLRQLRRGDLVDDLPPAAFPEMNPDAAEAGDVGRLRLGDIGRQGQDDPAIVFQVVDESTVMIQYEVTRIQTSISGMGTSHVRQTHRRTPETIGPFWIEGIATEGLVDGKPFERPLDSGETQYLGDLVYLCVGTKTYQTAIGGQRTIKALRAVDLDEFHAQINVLLQRAERADQ